MAVLLLNWESNYSASENFWPFSGNSELEDYDFTEFIIYIFFPPIILVILNLLKGPKEILQSKYDLTYERDSGPTIFGVALIVISLLFYVALKNYDEYDTEKVKEINMFLSISSMILRIAVTIWVANIATNLNRNSTGWSLLAFFLPSITLIAIGQKRKLKNP